DDFDVDQFVAECRKQVQLEEMREDLELYYKLLKTAMVELINKDYADFVNLSTNLVSCFHYVSICLLTDGKRWVCVMRLIQVVRSVEKIEKILHSQSSKDSSSLEISSDKADTVPGYDFLVNSVWPEMIRGIEERLAYIFNPGNPEIFYEVLSKTPTPEAPKELARPLPSSASSTSSRTSLDEGGSESGGPASLSTTQLVYIAADIQKLQEKVHAHII
ncbi:hypothetical protein XENOCAPTIV_009120, partial [Xenoophorus captivus]